jgi:hypothetical protein
VNSKQYGIQTNWLIILMEFILVCCDVLIIINVLPSNIALVACNKKATCFDHSHEPSSGL